MCGTSSDHRRISVDSLGTTFKKTHRAPIKQMKIRNTIGDLLKAAILCACVYGVVKWGPIELREDDVNEFAEKACIDEIRNRYDASSVNVYEIKESNNGYVVRASVELARGKRAKSICLTNVHGGVRDITIEQR
jgi:hypothetical protein